MLRLFVDRVFFLVCNSIHNNLQAHVSDAAATCYTSNMAAPTCRLNDFPVTSYILVASYGLAFNIEIYSS